MSAPLPLRRVAADVCVAAQLGPEHMRELAAAGFRSVINNRPDFEGGPTQPANAQVQAAALAAGLAYVYLPVGPMHQSADDIARFAELLRQLPKPIVAFCRSGNRSGSLFRAATAA